MLKKKDMYIDYKKSKRIDHQKNGNKVLKRSILAACFILIALGFLAGGYLFMQGKLPLSLSDFSFKPNGNTGDISKNESEYKNLEKEAAAESEQSNSNEILNNNSNGVEGENTVANPIHMTGNENDSAEDSIAEDSTSALSGEVINTTNGDNNQPDMMQVTARPEFIKGIYVSGQKAGIEKYMEELISLADDTEINAMVIDIKNDSGEITYKMELPIAEEIGAGTNYIKDINGLISKLKEKNIYLIARVVAFKDPLLADKKREFSLKNKDGSVFVDKSGDKWVNPYNRQVWDYLVDIGKVAAELGFDEIQFDYIRFSTDSGMKNVTYGEDAENKSKMDIITEFTKYACDKLKPLGVFVSADVYGTIIDSKIDAEIVGQDYKSMAEYLDYISPMIYPSHYQEGSYGIEYPDKEPYNLILTALGKSNKALKDLDSSTQATVRPWLQDFTATWLKHHAAYGADEIREQIQAVYDAGYTEWLLWNGSNNYTKEGLLEE